MERKDEKINKLQINRLRKYTQAKLVFLKHPPIPKPFPPKGEMELAEKQFYLGITGDKPRNGKKKLLEKKIIYY